MAERTGAARTRIGTPARQAPSVLRRARPAGPVVAAVVATELAAVAVVLLAVLGPVPAGAAVVGASVLAAAVVLPLGTAHPSVLAAVRARRARLARAAVGTGPTSRPPGDREPLVVEVADRSGRPVAVAVTMAAGTAEPGTSAVPGHVPRLVEAQLAGRVPGAAPPPSVDLREVTAVTAVLTAATPDPGLRRRTAPGPGPEALTAVSLDRVADVLTRGAGAPSAVRVLVVSVGAGTGRPAGDPARRSYRRLAGGVPVVRRLLVSVRLDPAADPAEVARHGGGVDGAVRAVAAMAARVEAELAAAGAAVRLLDRAGLAGATRLAAGGEPDGPAPGASAAPEPTGSGSIAGTLETAEDLRWSGRWHAGWAPVRMPSDGASLGRLADAVAGSGAAVGVLALECRAAVPPASGRPGGRGGAAVEIAVLARLTAVSRDGLARAAEDLQAAAAAAGVRLRRTRDEHGPVTAATLPGGGPAQPPPRLRGHHLLVPVTGPPRRRPAGPAPTSGRDPAAGSGGVLGSGGPA